VSKADPRVDAYGEVDELNGWLGLVRANGPGPEVDQLLDRIQRDLFALGAILADPAHKIASRVNKARLTDEDITRLERAIDSLQDRLPPLRRFILAGGSPAGALLHLARTVCRRAERRIVSLGAPGGSGSHAGTDSSAAEATDAADPVAVIYMNRLSDLLFVMARFVNHQAGVPEVEW
jgi:cob(I)alamin adenosyltransferase